jgi:AcrR family transcriptional regulator
VDAEVRPAGTRRRGAALEEFILEAAWQELDAVGYEQMTITSVAIRAQTSKQVLYRRWRNRTELAVAAVNHHVGPLSPEAADTGSLRGDLLALLDAVTSRVSAIDPAILRGILSDFLEDGNAFSPMMSTLVATLISRAVARGELPAVPIPARVLALPGDLARDVVARAIRPGGPADIMEAVRRPYAEIVDQVFLPLVRTYTG